MERRTFLKTSLATSAFSAVNPAFAHTIVLPDYDVPTQYEPREVDLLTQLEPWEVHVDPAQFALFWTLPDNKAIRYTVGVGRPGLYEDGEFYVARKHEWPSWTPTPDMIRREPEKYLQYADGVSGGLDNPLGARALYLYTPERGDTYLRIHGTSDASTLARRVSNGCARLINTHLVDLYNRVPVDSRVVLYPVNQEVRILTTENELVVVDQG